MSHCRSDVHGGTVGRGALEQRAKRKPPKWHPGDAAFSHAIEARALTTRGVSTPLVRGRQPQWGELSTDSIQPAVVHCVLRYRSEPGRCIVGQVVTEGVLEVDVNHRPSLARDLEDNVASNAGILPERTQRSSRRAGMQLPGGRDAERERGLLRLVPNLRHVDRLPNDLGIDGPSGDHTGPNRNAADPNRRGETRDRGVGNGANAATRDQQVANSSVDVRRRRTRIVAKPVLDRDGALHLRGQ